MVSLASGSAPITVATAAVISKSNPKINNTPLFFFARHGSSLLKPNIYPVSRFRKAKATTDSNNQQQQREDEEENFQVLTALRSKYNDIVIVDTPKSRMLLLDSTRNSLCHSPLNH